MTQGKGLASRIGGELHVSRRELLRQARAVRRARTAAVASLLPGVGHLIIGRRRTGLALLGLTIALVVGLGAWIATLDARRTERLAMRQNVLLAVAVGLVVAGVLWCATILSAYRGARPVHMTRPQRVGSGSLVAALCLGVMAPLTWSASSVYAARDVLHDTFRSDLIEATGDGPVIPGSPTPTPSPTPKPTPFVDKPRVNLLLLGGDAGADRTGLRTDTLVLASIDTVSGRTELISLPRNLQNLPLRPGTPLAQAYPNGFADFWFGIYTAAEDNPALMPDVRPENAGAAAITDTVAYVTGAAIDYYAVIDMDGFTKIVDAFGGVTVNVRSGDGRPLPIGGAHAANDVVTEAPHDQIALGRQHLDGYHALWYARSRFASSDDERQARQRCLLTGIIRQADPASLLTTVREFTSAAKQVLHTNIPAEVLPDFADLAREFGKSAQIDRITVLDVLGSSVHPNVEAIRARVADAVAGSLTPEATSDYGVTQPICPNLK